MRQREGRKYKHSLANDHGGTEEKVVDVIAEDCINHADSVEIGEFGFSLPWRDAPFKTKGFNDVFHTLCEPVCVSSHALSAFDGRSVWAIEDEEG